jgi:hypothetical protein
LTRGFLTRQKRSKKRCADKTPQRLFKKKEQRANEVHTKVTSKQSEANQTMKDPLTKTQESTFPSRIDEENAINTRPPKYQLLERLNECNNDKKECRICLEDDNEDDMIAPCKCKGSSQWVHRECLDLWRINEKDRAFSKCTECLFQYHMQPIRQQEDTSANNWRRAKFTMLVSRDFCFFTFLLQLVIGLLGCLVWLCDQDKSIPDFICGGCNGQRALGVYYLCGFLLVLVFLGCYGSVILCSNKCSVSDSIPSFDQEESPTYNRSEVYRSRRQASSIRTKCSL